MELENSKKQTEFLFQTKRKSFTCKHKVSIRKKSKPAKNSALFKIQDGLKHSLQATSKQPLNSEIGFIIPKEAFENNEIYADITRKSRKMSCVCSLESNCCQRDSDDFHFITFDNQMKLKYAMCLNDSNKVKILMEYGLNEMCSYACSARQLIKHFINIAEGKKTTHSGCEKTLKLDASGNNVPILLDFIDQPVSSKPTLNKERQSFAEGKPVSPFQRWQRKGTKNVKKFSDSVRSNFGRSRSTEKSTERTRRQSTIEILEADDVFEPENNKISDPKSPSQLVDSMVPVKKRNLTYNHSLIITNHMRLCDFNSRVTLARGLQKAKINADLEGTPNIKQVKIEHLQPTNLDSFDIGILYWQMLFRQKIFQTPTDKKLFKSLISDFVRPDIPEEVPKNLKKLILACWETQPKYRPTSIDLVKGAAN